MAIDVAVRRGLGWGDIARYAGVAELVLVGLVAVGLRDVDAAVTAAGLGASLLLLRFRHPVLGLAGLGLAFALTAFWSVTAAAVNLSESPGFFGSALPSVLSVFSVVGLVGWGGRLVSASSDRASAAPRALSAAGVVLLVVALVGSAVASRTSGVDVEVGDIELVMQRVKFADENLEASPGRIGLVLTNKDFFWHTFTIKELDVNLKVPTRGERRFEFDAPRGDYEFVCLIPGHTQAGMKGTLVVR
jgi:plastocyanin